MNEYEGPHMKTDQKHNILWYKANDWIMAVYMASSKQSRFTMILYCRLLPWDAYNYKAVHV